MGFTLVKPQNGRSQGIALGVDVYDRAPLGGKGYTGYSFFKLAVLFPKGLSCLTERIPEHLGILLCPTGLF